MRRFQRSSKLLLPLFPIPIRISSGVPTTLTVVRLRLEFSAVSAAIAQLPEDQRTALLLVAVEGRSYREVAEITGASVAAVTSRIARAREVLRGVVERSD